MNTRCCSKWSREVISLQNSCADALFLGEIASSTSYLENALIFQFYGKALMRRLRSSSFSMFLKEISILDGVLNSFATRVELLNCARVLAPAVPQQMRLLKPWLARVSLFS